MDAAWVTIHGVEADEYNGCVGEIVGEREDGSICVEFSGAAERVVVDPHNVVPTGWVPLPETMVFDRTTLRSVQRAPQRPARYVQFYDAEHYDIVIEAYEGRRTARYAVNGEWRPNFSSAEIVTRDVDGAPHRFLRVDIGSMFRRIPLPPEEGVLSSRLAALFKFCHLPSNLAKYESGDIVAFTRPLLFTEGESIPQGTPARVLGATDDEVEVLVASGDRFDVPKVDIMPAPPLAAKVTATLLREVNFESGKRVDRFSAVTVVKSAATKGMYEVRAGNAVAGTVFDVNAWWLRVDDGVILY